MNMLLKKKTLYSSEALYTDDLAKLAWPKRLVATLSKRASKWSL